MFSKLRNFFMIYYVSNLAVDDQQKMHSEIYNESHQQFLTGHNNEVYGNLLGV